MRATREGVGGDKIMRAGNKGGKETVKQGKWPAYRVPSLGPWVALESLRPLFPKSSLLLAKTGFFTSLVILSLAGLPSHTRQGLRTEEEAPGTGQFEGPFRKTLPSASILFALSLCLKGRH